MGKRVRYLAAVVSVAALVLAADAHPRGHRGGGWYGPPTVYGSWTVRECLASYRFHRDLMPYRHDLDYCFVRGRLTYVPRLIRGALRQTRHWQTPLARVKHREWRACLDTYREVGDLFRSADVCRRRGRGVPVADVLVDIEQAYRAHGL